MIKVIVFDLDDTLISEKEYIKSGFSHVSNVVSKMINIDCKDIYDSLLQLFNENSLNVFNRLFEKYNFKYSNGDIQSLIYEYRNHIPNIKFFDDVIPAINDLKSNGIKIGMITDGYKETQRNKIKVLNLESYIDYIIVTDELGREFWKPHKKSFVMMKEYFNVEYNEMAYVGDNIKKDFKAGNELGMQTIMINRENSVYNSCVEIEDIYKSKICIEKLNELLN